MKIFKSIRLSYLEDRDKDPEVQKILKEQTEQVFEIGQGKECIKVLEEFYNKEVTLVVENNPDLIRNLVWERKVGVLKGPLGTDSTLRLEYFDKNGRRNQTNLTDANLQPGTIPRRILINKFTKTITVQYL